jgi:hypothetical protein
VAHDMVSHCISSASSASRPIVGVGTQYDDSFSFCCGDSSKSDLFVFCSWNSVYEIELMWTHDDDDDTTTLIGLDVEDRWDSVYVIPFM